MILKRVISTTTALLTTLSVGIAGLTGVASAQSSITLTGPGSTNIITSNNSNMFNWFSSNFVGVNNFTNQFGLSGNANVSGNTVGGGAMSGNVWNNNGTTTSVGLGGGMMPIILGGTGAGSSFSIGTTGPGSFNSINASSSNTTNVSNLNTVGVTNLTTQTGLSGSANVNGNTIGGAATSGSVSNSSTSGAGVSITNGGVSGIVSPVSGTSSASITLTGPGSTNIINDTSTNSTTISNTNTVGVTNSTGQTSVSGSANVSGNTVGGGATSGSASNSSGSTTTVVIN